MTREHHPLDKLAGDDALRARLAAAAEQNPFVPQDAPTLVNRRRALRDIFRALTQAYWTRDDDYVYRVAAGNIPEDTREKIGVGGANEVRRLAAEFWTRAAIDRQESRPRDRAGSASSPLANTDTRIIMPPADINPTVIMPRYLDGSTGPAAEPSAEKTELFIMPYDYPADKPNK